MMDFFAFLRSCLLILFPLFAKLCPGYITYKRGPHA
ncbi:Uncharacterised protein [Serratia fonticola]|nr:Uncharacterised protein [Serratia fonticola]